MQQAPMVAPTFINGSAIGSVGRALPARKAPLDCIKGSWRAAPEAGFRPSAGSTIPRHGFAVPAFPFQGRQAAAAGFGPMRASAPASSIEKCRRAEPVLSGGFPSYSVPDEQNEVETWNIQAIISPFAARCGRCRNIRTATMSGAFSALSSRWSGCPGRRTCCR